MKKTASFLLAIVLMVSSALPCFAATNASAFFTGYILGLRAEGNCQMSVSFSVLGTGKMYKIGAFSIRIEEEVSPDHWIETFTVYGSSDPDTFYSENAMDHDGTYYFTGLPDVTYRAVMVGYARNENGYGYSRETTSPPKVCK